MTIMDSTENNSIGYCLCALVMAIDFNGSDYSFLQTATKDLINDIVGQTSGFMPRDIRALIADADANLIPKQNIQFDKVEPGNPGEKTSLEFKTVQGNKSCDDAPQVLGKEDLAKALERSKKRNATALGTPKVTSMSKTSSLAVNVYHFGESFLNRLLKYVLFCCRFLM